MPILNIEELKKYFIVYFFVHAPYEIFNALTTADQLFHFEDKLEVPKEIGMGLVDCHFFLYNEEGMNLASEIKSVSSTMLHQVANEIPFKMLRDMGIINLNEAEKRQMDQEKTTSLLKNLK